VDIVNLFDCERAAERALPRHLWDYIAGGATDELTTRRNRSAFDALIIRPRYLVDVSQRTLATTVLGAEVSLPVFISPAGNQHKVHPDGELATAQGAAKSGALMIVPAREGERIEELAVATAGPKWLQIYHRGRERTGELARRAEAAGYLAICITVDVPIVHTKERDLRNNFLPPHDYVFDASHGPIPTPWVDVPLLEQFTYKDVEWLRGATQLPVVIKGINTPEDARLAVESGANGILVSTHGGRIFDSTLSSIESLPEVVEAVAGRGEVYLDSGVRRGADVFKALALGARAVGIGRPFFWGLSMGGAQGVHLVLEILRGELDVTLAFCGYTAVQDVERRSVDIPVGWGAARL